MVVFLAEHMESIQTLMLACQWLLVGFPSLAGRHATGPCARQPLGVPICEPCVLAPEFLVWFWFLSL